MGRWGDREIERWGPIQVECYSGSRADERPRRLVINGREHVVARLLAESIEEGVDSKERLSRFTVMTEEGLTIELVRAHGGEWYLASLPR